jgi:hyperosmotically inducible protein
MQNSKLMNTVVGALLAGAMSMSFAAGQDKQAPAPMPAALPSAPAATGGAVTDDAITASAKTALSTDAQLAGLAINLSVKKGVVSVSGDVPSAAAGERVLQIVAMVNGVKDVKNSLKVKAAG